MKEMEFNPSKWTEPVSPELLREFFEKSGAKAFYEKREQEWRNFDELRNIYNQKLENMETALYILFENDANLEKSLEYLEQKDNSKKSNPNPGIVPQSYNSLPQKLPPKRRGGLSRLLDRLGF